VVIQSSNLPFRRIAVAVAAALVAALALAGCGRKSGLDLPPMASAGDQTAPGQPAPAAREPTSGPTLGPDGRPVAPQTDKRRTPLDWLLN
jgi:predicted small lipoprotein YifL